MTQPALLDWPPRTHRDDPAASHEAESRSRGVTKLRRAALLKLVRELPGLTASAYAGLVSNSELFPANQTERRDEVRKRLSDLRTVCGSLCRRHTRGDRESRWFPVGGSNGDAD